MNLSNKISKITKTIKNEGQENCDKINNKCMQKCLCEISEVNTIIRYFEVEKLYNWEISVYLHLIDSKITPLITSGCYILCYILKDYESLRNFLNKKQNKSNENTSLILNELYSFINSFKKYNFIHGNLHIDNIFIKQLNNNTYEFKVIDYVNSYILHYKKTKNYDKTSYLGEYKEKEKFIQYWDFFTVFISLKSFYKNKPDNLFKLHQITESYIPINIFNNMLNKILKEKEYLPFQSTFFF